MTNCTRYCWETLSDYLDGELSPLQRWRIARHVKTCRSCAGQLAELEALALTARERFSDATTPSTLAQNAQEALPDSFVQKEVTKMIRRYQAQAAFATVGTVAIAGMGGAVLLTPILRPTPALAEVTQAIRTLKTIQWDDSHQTFTQTSHDTQTIKGDRGHALVDLVRDAVRINGTDSQYAICTKAGILFVDGKTAWRAPATSASTFADLVQRPSNWISHAATGWTRSEELIGGKRLVRYDSRAGQASRWSFWVDPATRLLVRTETEAIRGKERTLHLRENFRYNEPIAPEQFSMALPKGVTLMAKPAQ